MRGPLLASLRSRDHSEAWAAAAQLGGLLWRGVRVQFGALQRSGVSDCRKSNQARAAAADKVRGRLPLQSKSSTTKHTSLSSIVGLTTTNVCGFVLGAAIVGKHGIENSTERLRRRHYSSLKPKTLLETRSKASPISRGCDGMALCASIRPGPERPPATIGIRLVWGNYRDPVRFPRGQRDRRDNGLSI